MESELYGLCRKYTSLSDEDVARLRTLEEHLSTVANIEQADVFIDCPVREKDLAVVVSQARPDSVESSYHGSVVGLYAKPENEPSVLRSLALGVGTQHVKAVTQENATVVQTVEPIRNKGRTIGVLIIEKRVSSDGPRPALTNGEMDDIISDNSWLTRYIDLAVLMVSKKGIVCYRNTQAQRLYTKLGYVDDILGMPYENILLHSSLLASLDDGKPFSNAEVTAGGLVLEVRQILLNKNGISFATIIRDVTSIHENEKQLVLKSVAIKEIHHRVKNSLQTIASILSLQMRRSSSPEVQAMLRDVINRVLAISATHELLLGDSTDKVGLGGLLRKIADNHVHSFTDQSGAVSIEVHGDDFPVYSDTANSVAIIINELLQNAVKYAFRGRPGGRVDIRLQNDGPDIRIRVKDNGVGFNVDTAGRNSLGLLIIEAMVRDKLHGQLSITSSDKGTDVSFTFKNQNEQMATPAQA